MKIMNQANGNNDKQEKLLKLQLEIEAFKERLAKREIWVNGLITDSLIETLYVNLLKLQEQSQTDPITVVINSLGGNFYESIVATDMMGTLPNPMKTIALANAVSGGFILLMGGDERICHDYTCLMMHSASFGAVDKAVNIKDRFEYVNYSQEKMAKFFSLQTGGRTTPGYWMDLFNSGKDKWFSVEEALKLGIIHRVIKRKEMVDPSFSLREPFTWDITDFNRANQ